MQMKYLSVAVVAVVASTMFAQESAQKLEAIKAETLNQRDVTGRLGLPLGRAVEVIATIISGDDTRRKADAGRYFLRVDSINGKPQEAGALFKFEVPFADAQLANDHFSLYELKNDRKASKLTSKEVQTLEKGYVDSKVKLLVYETGRYHGIPDGLPADVPIWQDTGFGFSTYLIVLKQRKMP